MSNEKLKQIRTKISHITVQFHAVEMIEQLLAQGKVTVTEYNGTVAVFLNMNSELQNLILEYIAGSEQRISEAREWKAKQDKRIEDLGFTP